MACFPGEDTVEITEGKDCDTHLADKAMARCERTDCNSERSSSVGKRASHITEKSFVKTRVNCSKCYYCPMFRAWLRPPQPPVAAALISQ